jgi:hypothetical protein
VPKRAHHHIGIEHMIPMELTAAKVKEAVAARGVCGVEKVLSVIQLEKLLAIERATVENGKP